MKDLLDVWLGASLDLDVTLNNFGTWSREYYGADRDNCPNDHCFWSHNGWMETDEHFRERILQRVD